MSSYELRAEHQPANPVGRETMCWRIVRRHHLVALCGRLIDPVSEQRSIGRVEEITPDCRCVDCWNWWVAVREAHRAETRPMAARTAGPATAGRQPWPAGH
jgi:hypothetical protein